MARRFQFSLRALLAAMTVVAVAAAALPLFVRWLPYVVFFGDAIMDGLCESFRESPRRTLIALVTLSIPITVLSVLIWALVVAMREKCGQGDQS